MISWLGGIYIYSGAVQCGDDCISRELKSVAVTGVECSVINPVMSGIISQGGSRPPGSIAAHTVGLLLHQTLLCLGGVNDAIDFS